MESSEAVDTASDITEAVLDHVQDDHDHSDGEKESKMHHLMHSDTIIVVLSLVVMIVLGLVFRSLCMKLASINQRKERMRGGLKQMAESMNYVTRSMSNDLELPNCPKAVLRTYSNYGRSDQSSPQRGDMHANSMRVHAINNNFSKQEAEELEMQMSVAQSVNIQIPEKMER